MSEVIGDVKIEKLWRWSEEFLSARSIGKFIERVLTIILCKTGSQMLVFEVK
jgi:hypothetical protein